MALLKQLFANSGAEAVSKFIFGVPQKIKSGAQALVNPLPPPVNVISGLKTAQRTPRVQQAIQQTTPLILKANQLSAPERQYPITANIAPKPVGEFLARQFPDTSVGGQFLNEMQRLRNAGQFAEEVATKTYQIPESVPFLTGEAGVRGGKPVLPRLTFSKQPAGMARQFLEGILNIPLTFAEQKFSVPQQYATSTLSQLVNFTDLVTGKEVRPQKLIADSADTFAALLAQGFFWSKNPVIGGTKVTSGGLHLIKPTEQLTAAIGRSSFRPIIKRALTNFVDWGSYGTKEGFLNALKDNQNRPDVQSQLIDSIKPAIISGLEAGIGAVIFGESTYQVGRGISAAKTALPGYKTKKNSAVQFIDKNGYKYVFKIREKDYKVVKDIIDDGPMRELVQANNLRLHVTAQSPKRVAHDGIIAGVITPQALKLFVETGGRTPLFRSGGFIDLFGDSAAGKAANKGKKLFINSEKDLQNIIKKAIKKIGPQEHAKLIEQYGLNEGNGLLVQKYAEALGYAGVAGKIGNESVTGLLFKNRKGPDIAPEKVEQTINSTKQVIENFRLDKVENVKDVEGILQRTGRVYETALKSARGGTISQQETIDTARRLGLKGYRRLLRNNPDEFAAQVYATNDYVVAKARQIKELQELLADPAKATPVAQVQLQQQMAELGLTMAVAIKNTAAAGRALNILKVTRKALQDPTVDSIFKVQKMAQQWGYDPRTVAQHVARLETPDEIYKYARNLYRPKIGDKVREIFYNSLLSAPGTQIVNTTSNTVNLLLAPLEATLSGTVDAVLARGRFKKGFQRERYAKEGIEGVIGMAAGFKTGVRKALSILTRGYSEDDIVKMELAHLPAIKTPYLGGAIRTPSKLMIASDAFFKAMQYEAGLRMGAYRIAKQSGRQGKDMKLYMAELLDTPSKELMNFAGQYSKYYLFQKDPGPVTQAVMKARNAGQISGFRPLELVIPFVQIPANVMKFGLERSPAGVVNIALKKGGERADAIARTFIGGSIAAGIAMLFAENRITGAPPKNSAERDAFYRQGKIPYAVRIGDNWYSYQRLEPFNQIFGQIALVQSLIREKPDADVSEVVTRVGTGIAQNLISQTYMQGLSNVLDAIEDPERYGQKFLNNFGQMLIPSGVRATARAVDRTIRQTSTPLEAAVAGLPGISEALPAKLNVFGEPIKRPGGALREFIPYKKSEVRETTFEQELKSLGDPIGYPGKKATGIQWDQDSYTDVLKMSGPRIKQRLLTEMNRTGWVQKPEKEKLKIIKKLIDEERDTARERVLPAALARYYQIPVDMGVTVDGITVIPGLRAADVARQWEILRKSPEFAKADRLEQQAMVRRILIRTSSGRAATVVPERNQPTPE